MDHMSRTSLVTHPLDPGDEEVTAALRDMTRSAVLATPPSRAPASNGS
jgi:hypothetical protein